MLPFLMPTAPRTTAHRVGLALGVALLGAAAHAAQPAWFDGNAFEGPVTLHFTAPGKTARTVQGTGSARWVADGANAARFVLQAEEPRTNTHVYFTLEGQAQPGGWRSAPGPVSLAVSQDGRITGGGTDPALQRTLNFAGTVSATALDLQTRTALGRAEGGLPAGTQITASYALQRVAAPAPASTVHCPDGGMAIVPERDSGLAPRTVCR